MPHFQVNSVFLSIPLCPCIQVVDQLCGEQFPDSHSPSISDSVGITSSCSLLAFPLSVYLVSSCLHCLCFSVSILSS